MILWLILHSFQDQAEEFEAELSHSLNARLVLLKAFQRWRMYHVAWSSVLMVFCSHQLKTMHPVSNCSSRHQLV